MLMFYGIISSKSQVIKNEGRKNPPRSEFGHGWVQNLGFNIKHNFKKYTALVKAGE